MVRDYRRKKASLLSFCFLIFLVLRYLCETFLKKSIYPTSSYLQKLEGGLDIEIPNLQVTFAPTNVSYSILIWKVYKKCIFISLSVYNRRLNLYINKDLQKNCSLSLELSFPTVDNVLDSDCFEKKKSPFCTVDDVLYGDCLDHTDQNPRKVEHKEHDHLQREW